MMDLQEQKDLENHKGYWTVLTNIQKIGNETPMAILKMLVLISGGAMIGVLTFVGNLWSRNDQMAREVGKDLSEGMLWFGIALGLSLLAALIGWVAQFTIGHALAQKFINGKISAVRHAVYPLVFSLMIVTAAALSCFVIGMYQSFNGLIRHV
jgi:hypothetical protein